ncbi:permease prefix domain 1-containing protein [Aeromicrobium sp. Leaf350]|uniref:permease prefix domain 1-containing protein n=1 Tax=Aeromicrobium sp. Leaf350 TaxID=2876565 RepID=UPI001E469E10|nr:permease prefix domain 1-containing protein [Aeromicrobium sp. Leaf350]
MTTTQTNTLTDRYVHATTRWMSEEKRDDISRELTATIDDMIAGRVEAGEDPAEAERDVLTELGDPSALAAQYGNQPLHLIGPRYFLLWRRLTLLGLIWIPATVGVIVALAQLASTDDPASVIGHGIGTAFEVAVQVVFWTTLAFAILERVDVDAKIPGWSIDRLPEVPRRQQIGLADMIAGVFFTGLVIAVLVLQHFRSWVEGPSGDDVPVLDPDLWSFWLPLLIGVLVVSMVFEVVKFRIGRFTWPVVAGTILISLAWAVPFIYLAANDMLLSPEFVQALDITPTVLDRINLGTVLVTIAVEVGTVIDAVVKNRKATRAPGA